MLRHVTHNYIINFVEELFPLASEAHCGYISLHKYVITIICTVAVKRAKHKITREWSDQTETIFFTINDDNLIYCKDTDLLYHAFTYITTFQYLSVTYNAFIVCYIIVMENLIVINQRLIPL